MLAMVVNDDMGSLDIRGALAIFVSMRAPAKYRRRSPSRLPVLPGCFGSISFPSQAPRVALEKLESVLALAPVTA
jgi:hypothetical protein